MHTGLTLYQLHHEPTTSGVYALNDVEIRPIAQCSVDIGLSSTRIEDVDKPVINNQTNGPKTLGQTLEEISACGDRLLREQLGQQMPDADEETKPAAVRVIFGATAGLRLSHHVQNLRTELLLARAQSHLLRWFLSQQQPINETAHLRHWQSVDLDFLGIISGEQEAFDACLAVNNQFLLQKTQSHPAVPTGKLFGTGATSVPSGKLEIGLMELGGASLQIAYPLIEPFNTTDSSNATMESNNTVATSDSPQSVNSNLPNKDTNVLSIEGARLNSRNVRQWKHQQVLVSSHLCFGLKEFRLRLLLLLTKDSPGQKDVRHPCYNPNINFTVQIADLKRECLHLFPVDIPPETEANPSPTISEFVVTGDYDQAQCDLLVQRALNPEKCTKEFYYCPRSELPSPPDKMEFQAISNFYYAVRALNPQLDTLGYDQLRNLTMEWCKSSLKDRLRPDLEEKYALHYCITLHYASFIITDLFKVSKNTFERIHFGLGNQSDIQPDWTWGYLLQSMSFESWTKYQNANACIHNHMINHWLVAGFLVSLVLAGIAFYARWRQTRLFKL